MLNNDHSDYNFFNNDENTDNYREADSSSLLYSIAHLCSTTDDSNLNQEIEYWEKSGPYYRDDNYEKDTFGLESQCQPTEVETNQNFSIPISEVLDRPELQNETDGKF